MASNVRISHAPIYLRLVSLVTLACAAWSAGGSASSQRRSLKEYDTDAERHVRSEGVTAPASLGRVAGAEAHLGKADTESLPGAVEAESQAGVEAESPGGVAEEEEEEGEEFDEVEVTVACMLLGGVSFVMCIFQVVNWDDDDVRRYAWRVISNTIAIFMSVLFFTGNKVELLQLFVGFPHWVHSVVHIIHCLTYIVLLLLVIGLNTGVWCAEKDYANKLRSETWTYADAMRANYGAEIPQSKHNDIRAHKRGEKNQRRSVYLDDEDFGLEVAAKKIFMELEHRKLQNSAYAKVLAHCAGFAAIAAGGSMQHLPMFRWHPSLCLIPIGIITALLLGAFRISAGMRQKVKAEAEAEGRQGLRAQLITHFCLEAENDILALSLSFLTVQVIRFAITGELPNMEGLENAARPTLAMAAILCTVGVLFIVASLSLSGIINDLHEKHTKPGEPHHELPWQSNLLIVLMQALTMSFAWCVMYGVRWAWMARPLRGMAVTSMPARILMAVLLSGISFVLVVFLDKIDDWSKRNQKGTVGGASALVGSSVLAISLLVGFSWEHSFDGAVTAVAELSRHHKRLAKFGMGLIVNAGMMVPWRRFILKKALQLEELKLEREIAARDALSPTQPLTQAELEISGED